MTQKSRVRKTGATEFLNCALTWTSSRLGEALSELPFLMAARLEEASAEGQREWVKHFAGGSA